MKILFCTDGSEASYYALNQAIPFFKKDAVIDIIYVIDWGFFPTYVTFPTEESFPPDNKEMALSILTKTAEVISSSGLITGVKEYLDGNPSEMILNELKEKNYDLVVLGSHSKRGIQNWLGSVSRKVVNKSSTPVLIVRQPKNKQIVTLREKQQVLVATDGSGCSYNSMRKLVELFDQNNFTVDILTVRPGADSLPLEIAMDNEWLAKCIDKQKEISEEVLDTAEKIFKELNVKIQEKICLEGDAASKILEYAEKNEPNMIVMGSHGREGFSDMLLGSVSKRILDNCNAPVLIVAIKQ